MRFIDAWSLTSHSGDYTAAIEVGGVVVPLRADDGIHLTSEGGSLIARAVARDAVGD